MPVFRYALERWEPAPYQVIVFHHGALPAPEQAAVDLLRRAAEPESGAGCIVLHTIDLDASPSAAAKSLWDAQPGASAPWMVVRYPPFMEVPDAIWAGPLTKESVSAALDSPARRRIAKALLEGQSGLFVLLESGVRDKDDAVAALLDTELRRNQEELKLPDLSPGQWDDPAYDENGPPTLRVAFSVIRLARTDPAEQVFVKMLLGPGTLPEEAKGPVVFPFVGRGRALCAIPAPDLTAERIEAECEFLVGPCSCIVKDMNPGLDMLMAVDWDAALAGEPSAIPPVDPPPVTGLAAFATAPQAPEPSLSWSASTLVRRAVAAAIIGFALLMAGIVIWRKRHPRND